jgi:hypothetical protein
MIYDGQDVYRGDLVRWKPEMTWSWQPYDADKPFHTDHESAVFNGTLEECLAAIQKLAE